MDLVYIIQKAKKIKAVVLDGDGVLFTGRVFLDKNGECLKERSLVDGKGLSLLRATGVRIAFVSGESTDFIEALGNKANKPLSAKRDVRQPVDVFTGLVGVEKVKVIETWLAEISVKWSECAYMGDDLSDYEILKKVGFPTAPAQAEKIIKDICVFVAERRGGDGAIRDLTNFILDAKCIDQTQLTRR